MYNAINFLSPGSVHAGYPATAVYDILHAQYVLQLHCFDCSIDAVYTARQVHLYCISVWVKIPTGTKRKSKVSETSLWNVSETLLLHRVRFSYIHNFPISEESL